LGVKPKELVKRGVGKVAKKRSRGNGDGDVWPRRNKEGRITSYRGAYFGPDGKRRYVSGQTKRLRG